MDVARRFTEFASTIAKDDGAAEHVPRGDASAGGRGRTALTATLAVGALTGLHLG